MERHRGGALCIKGQENAGYGFGGEVTDVSVTVAEVSLNRVGVPAQAVSDVFVGCTGVVEGDTSSDPK